MLTGALARPRLRAHKGKLLIDHLHGHAYQQTATDLIQLFNQHHQQTQQAWETSLEDFIGHRTDYIVIRGLAKVLTDAATFTAPDTPLVPSELREYLFAHGPVFAESDIFQPQTRAEILDRAAAELNIPVEDMESALYGDLPAAYVLTDIGPEWDTESLVARYNLELARAALYWSDSMTIDVYDNFKDFWRYLKLFRLMFWSTPQGNGFHVELDGPISPFVKSTTRYGRQFAAFLPALFLCQRWQMRANVRLGPGKASVVYELDDRAPLTTHFKHSPAFDSQMEADFAAEFEAKFGDERGPWQLSREDQVLLLGDTVMLPDFTITHKADGRRALIEIVGFWHWRYLQRKIDKVRAANRTNMILLVYEGVNLSPDRLEHVPAEVLYFKNKPVLKDVIAAVEHCASHD
jgi:uncharacterized protein